MFTVDNGHGEDLDSPLTQMCMVRLLRFLKIANITQRSFAEYHSKRNFVERVHAAENEALSRHGAFTSKKKHAYAEPYSKEHRENMEAMAEEVQQCLSSTRFGDHFIKSFRGISGKLVFDDEKRLKEFLAMSEESKLACNWTYQPMKNESLSILA